MLINTGTEPKAANPLDALRNNIELDNRFKTAFHGYDKRCVQDYIAQLSAASEEALALKATEIDRLNENNAELLARAQNQEKLISDARADERHKLEGAISIKESMLEGLRQTNARLEAENHRLQLQITDLQARLAETKSRHSDANASACAINDQLADLLAGKLAECSGIIANWKAEAESVLKSQPCSAVATDSRPYTPTSLQSSIPAELQATSSMSFQTSIPTELQATSSMSFLSESSIAAD